MLRKVLSVAVLGLASSAAFVAAGCASNEKPYGLTGEKSVYGANGAGPNSPLSAQERARYTDSKGHFHPDWVGQAGR